ncbi:MAG: hypothetical protein ACPG4Z_02470 [Chitinophagales bacterium]
MNRLLPFLKKSLPYLVSVIIILIANVAIFSPQLDNKKLPSGDSVSAEERTYFIRDYMDNTGERVYWNPAEFGGNPIYMLALGKDNNFLKYTTDILTLGLDRPIGMFFMIGIIMFSSLCLLRVNPWIALAVTIIYTLNVNYFVLYEAGHAKKILTIAYFPFIISGVILCFRQQYIKGLIPLLLGISLAVFHSHVQMVLYMIMALLVFGIPYLIYSIKTKKIKELGIALGLMVLVAGIAGLTDYAQLITSQKFSESTMRGGSVLEKENSDNTNPQEKKLKGLEWDYAMQWSFEIEDFLAILVPRMVGGSSGEAVDKDNAMAKLMIQNGSPVKDGKVVVPAYWSTMVFTSGTPYFGITILFIFIFSCIAFRKPVFFGLTGVFILLFLISLGENASWFNRVLFDYFPLLNKFRTPSSITVFLPAFVAIGAALGLYELSQSEDKSQYSKPLYISIGIVGGLVLIIAVMGGSIFSFLSPNDLNYPAAIQSTLIEGRKELMSADAWRSFFFILATGGTIWLYLSKKLKSPIALAAILLVIFAADIIPISKRYITNDKFISEAQYDIQFLPRNIDKDIAEMETKSRAYYRVYDQSINTFNSGKASIYHNQIGGYNPTKLQRYQDIIEYHIAQSNMQVFNMLNTKYFVKPEGQILTNPDANGVAWFVNEIITVNSAQEEIEALTNFNSKTQAVININEFEANAGDKNGTIELVKAFPNRLVYQTNSSTDQLAVFSEIWYGGDPDWTVTIDGIQSNYIRANYILRAMQVPAGDHEIVFEFKPKAEGAMISTIASLFSILLILAGIGYGVKQTFSAKDEK